MKCQTTIARIRTGFPVGGHPRNVPHVLRDDTRFVGAQDAANSHREVGEAFPMLAIAFRCLRRPNERFRRAHDVIAVAPLNSPIGVVASIAAWTARETQHSDARLR